MVSETFGLKPDGIRRGLGLKGCISGFVVSVCTYSSRIADDRWISRPPRRYRFSFLSYGLGRLSTFPCPAYGIQAGLSLWKSLHGSFRKLGVPYLVSL